MDETIEFEDGETEKEALWVLMLQYITQDGMIQGLGLMSLFGDLFHITETSVGDEISPIVG